MNRRHFLLSTAVLAAPRLHAATAPVEQTVVLGAEAPDVVFGSSALAARRHAACSTFKIPLTLMALESGVVTDPDAPVALDARTYEPQDWWTPAMREGWGRPHSLRSAFEVSAVWFYRRLALQMGADTVAAWLAAFDYGNRDMSAGLDNFWNAGDRGVLISPREQWRFLRRVAHREFALAPATYDVAFDVFVTDRDERGILRAKTGLGWIGQTRETGLTGWYVGWVESTPGGAVTPFASLCVGQGQDVLRLRIENARAALREAGLFT